MFIKSKPKAALIASLLAISFLAANQLLLQPLNFGAFSQVMPYFISGLAALLGIVVGFSSFSMQNETSSMASQLKKLDEELDRIGELLRPLKPESEIDTSETFSSATRYATEAIYHMVQATSKMANTLLSSHNAIEENDGSLKSICKDFLEETIYRLSLFFQTGSIYSLATISTTDFLIRLRFKPITDISSTSDAVKEFYDTLRHLHVLRNIASTIFMRHNIANLSYEMLFSAIPIIAFIAAVSFTFSYEANNPTTVRLVYASTFSVSMLPFILFAIRTVPLVHMTKSNSGLPFSHK